MKLKLNSILSLMLLACSVLLVSSCKRIKRHKNPIVVPPGYAVQGIDLSHYQGHVNWKKVSQQKEIKFAFIKATEGISVNDSKFKINWKSAKSIGMKRGAFHYFRPEVSGFKQADFFLRTVDFNKGDLYPVLDLEVNPKGPISLFYKEIDAWIKRVELKTGKKPILYASRKYYTSYLEERYSNHHLWVANYKTQKIPLNGKWKFWQHTEEARISGVSGMIDLNVFNGTEADLLKLCF